MNRKAQAPTILIFLAAIVLSVLTLFALLTFNNNFKSESLELSEMMQEVEFNKQYTIAQATLLLSQSKESCPTCSADQTKEKLQTLAKEKESTFLYEGTGNFYGRIRAGDFNITTTDKTTTLQIDQVFSQSQRGNNKIKRFFDITIQQ